jgi:hypothetical protein
MLDRLVAPEPLVKDALQAVGAGWGKWGESFRSAGTGSQNFTQGRRLSMPNCLTMGALSGSSRLPMVVYMRASGVSYLNDSGVPHFSQKPRRARLELAKKLGEPRVHAKLAGDDPASAANSPPVARWHMRQWQAWLFSGGA